MPPELIRGDAVSSWEAVDSYGVGCIAHDVTHINTGAAAPAAREAGGDDHTLPSEWAQEKRMAAAALLAAARPGSDKSLVRAVDPCVPTVLASVIQLCLADDPHARPSMTAVRAMLTTPALGAHEA